MLISLLNQAYLLSFWSFLNGCSKAFMTFNLWFLLPGERTCPTHITFQVSPQPSKQCGDYSVKLIIQIKDLPIYLTKQFFDLIRAKFKERNTRRNNLKFDAFHYQIKLISTEIHRNVYNICKMRWTRLKSKLNIYNTGKSNKKTKT